jgi:hypothetical protein
MEQNGYMYPSARLYYQLRNIPTTYDHRTLKTRLPVRSALFKQRTGGLVVRWVTTSEYPLLYVFFGIFCCCTYYHACMYHLQGPMKCWWDQLAAVTNWRVGLFIRIVILSCCLHPDWREVTNEPTRMNKSYKSRHVGRASQC